MFPCFCCTFASLIENLPGCACMCEVGSDPVISGIATLSCPEHGGVCGQQPSVPGRYGTDHQPSHPRTISEFEVQLFVQTHGLVHLRNVQAHSSSHSSARSQPRSGPGHPYPELGLRLDHMANQKMKMTGVNGYGRAFVPMMIGGEPDHNSVSVQEKWHETRWTCFILTFGIL